MLKNKIGLLFFGSGFAFLVFLFSGYGYAQDVDFGDQVPSVSVHSGDWKVIGYVEGGFSHLNHVESVGQPFKSQSSGWIPSLGFGGRSESRWGWLLEVNARFRFGDTVYDAVLPKNGLMTDTETASFDGTVSNFFWTVEGLVGAKVVSDNRQNVAVYSGLGFISWERILYTVSEFKEIYNLPYLPMGIRYYRLMTPDVSVGVDLSYRHHLGTSKSVNIDSAPNISKDLSMGNGGGWKLSVPVTIRRSAALTVKIIPWFEQWTVGKSDVYVVDYLFSESKQLQEPASETTQYGITVSLEM